MSDARKDQILAAHHFRHACKEFDPTQKISDDDIRFLLEIGRLSPSSFGFEPWKFVVVQNPEIREKIGPVAWGAQNKLETASHFVLLLARTKHDLMYDSEYIARLTNDVHHLPPEAAARRNSFYKEFVEEEFKLLENDRALFDWACKQTYIALANMMTSAAEIGIDSCPIEGFHKEKLEQVLREVGIMKDNRFGLACMVAFGYRVHQPREKTRQSFDDVVEWV